MNHKIVSQFKLEEDIQSAWNIVEDLSLVVDSWENLSDNDKKEIITGIRTLYAERFRQLFDTYSKVFVELNQ